jgi:hypothetical protein
LRPALELAQVLEVHWASIQATTSFNAYQLRTLDALRRCRTASLGGHVDACSECGLMRISYNSCRNRHCPKCQNLQKEEWMLSREAELLPVSYFHVVFTLPDSINPLAIAYPAKVYNLLFQAAWQTMQSFALDAQHLGAQAGMIAILHTWGQNLSLHPHLHCIVPGGGITDRGKWKSARSQGKYLFPVKALSKVFRAKFVKGVRKQFPNLGPSFFTTLFKKEWVVYAKRPFFGPKQVIEYLGRYTHKIAISNHRLLSHQQGNVTFSYKDYRHGGAKKQLTLTALEFVRRFSLHILPKSFVRIRHFGFLSAKTKVTALPSLMESFGKGFVVLSTEEKKQKAKERLKVDPLCCPACKTPTMVTVCYLTRAGPVELDCSVEVT